ncbi:hypothetical protein O9G_006040 [Rozella allomycis CSF55]|uniref:Sugar transporter SWEET1 n=1 Tax=Rozella allomycis (strain CSF55) TaxID=988480 RepID=A0A075B3D7_ROZAC|nr:hypothetical protein O9G_006040 [Rozella allomycis CSF55]|eukprot:EPZ35481.1 hypothetical protein O9G_006040 [Rozella allomycis CSF55]
MFINCICWLKYGLLLADEAMVLAYFTSGLFILGLFYGTDYIAKNYSFVNAMHILGLFCCLMSVTLSGSPLVSLRTGNKGSMNYPGILSAVLGGIWTYYGYQINDLFVTIPNLLGFLISMFQIYIIYAWGNRYTKLESKE